MQSSTDVPLFDPLELAVAVREGRMSPPAVDDLDRFGARGAWQAGSAALRVALAGWWVGETARVEAVLALAADWFSRSETDAVPWGDPPLFYEARQRHARALAGWMTGSDHLVRWREAATALAAYDRVKAPGEVIDEVERAVLNALADAAPAALPTDEADVLDALTNPTRAPAVHPRFVALLERHLESDPDTVPTTLLAYAFGRCARLRDPAACVSFAYALLPQLPLPPGLIERGWSDACDARASVWNLSIGTLHHVLMLLGLTRDRDAVVQPAPPTFASWTRHPALDLEVDWHAPSGETPWIEVRGDGAGRLAAALAEASEGAVRSDPIAAFAELLTAPPTMHDPANGQTRWEILTTALAGRDTAATEALTPLIGAGLADTDWRVRMAAVWGVGALRLSTFADRAATAQLPAANSTGLNADDRHVLLALRDAAILRARGDVPLPPTRAGSGPGGTARAAFVAKVGTLFENAASPPTDRGAALIAALLRQPDLAQDRLPRSWRTWAA